MIYITTGKFCWGRADGPDQSLAFAVRELNVRLLGGGKRATFVTYECEDDDAEVNDMNDIVAITGSKIEVVAIRKIPVGIVIAYRQAVAELVSKEWESEEPAGVTFHA